MSPVGAERDDTRTGLQTAVLGNLIRSAAGAKGEPIAVEDVTLAALLRRRDDDRADDFNDSEPSTA